MPGATLLTQQLNNFIRSLREQVTSSSPPDCFALLLSFFSSFFLFFDTIIVLVFFSFWFYLRSFISLFVRKISKKKGIGFSSLSIASTEKIYVSNWHVLLMNLVLPISLVSEKEGNLEEGMGKEKQKWRRLFC